MKITKEILNKNFTALGNDVWSIPNSSCRILAKTYGNEVEFDLYKRFVIGSESKFRFLTSLYDTDDLNAVIRLFVVKGLQFELK